MGNHAAVDFDHLGSVDSAAFDATMGGRFGRDCRGIGLPTKKTDLIDLILAAQLDDDKETPSVSFRKCCWLTVSALSAIGS